MKFFFNSKTLITVSQNVFRRREFTSILDQLAGNFAHDHHSHNAAQRQRAPVTIVSFIRKLFLKYAATVKSLYRDFSREINIPTADRRELLCQEIIQANAATGLL